LAVSWRLSSVLPSPPVPRLPALVALLVAVPLGVAAAQTTTRSVDVVVVGGPMDHRTVAFVTAAITDTDADLVVLQLDIEAVVGGDIGALRDLIADPPVPVALWVGPQPATLQGAAVQLFAAAAIRGAAPGVTIGRASPPLAGGEPLADRGDLPAAVVDDLVVVAAPDGVLVDVVAPSIGQFVVGLNGREVVVGGVTVVLDTARTEVVDGVERLVPSAPVRFVSEGLIDRVLHVAIRPEAAFFFLLAGLVFAVFEFYAAGPGLAAAVGAVSLLLAGYGLAVMPTWWPALAAVLAGVVLYVIDLQRNDLAWRSILGTALLLFAGFRLVDGAPQLVPVWWTVVLIVIGTALFFGFALTTVVRARFSTDTIGRTHLIGRRGVAVGAISPDGEVEVDGVRWKARSTRRSGIDSGDAVVVARIDGVVLEVEPA
jgi:membrane-bound serine protease (ClpP class)